MKHIARPQLWELTNNQPEGRASLYGSEGDGSIPSLFTKTVFMTWMSNTFSTEDWDVHKHKDELQVSDAATIYHSEHGQLCWCERHWDCLLYHPIKWKDRESAYKWIADGCIAELQEGLMCLAVGFSTVSYEKRSVA